MMNLLFNTDYIEQGDNENLGLFSKTIHAMTPKILDHFELTCSILISLKAKQNYDQIKVNQLAGAELVGVDVAQIDHSQFKRS